MTQTYDFLSEAKIPGVFAPPEKEYHKAAFQLGDLDKLGNLKHSWNLSEMGTYKTSTALWLAEIKLAQQPQSSRRPSILYLTSKTGKTPVLELVQNVLPTWSIYLLDSGGPVLLNPHTKNHAPANLYLAHYELLQKRGKFSKILTAHDWLMVIADEAHKFKSPKAQVTRAVWKLKAKYKHLMTGSPFANNIGELYSLLHFLAPREFRSFNEFKKEYAVIETDDYGYEKFSKDGISTEQARAIREIISRFGVRHTKRELFPQLPDLYPPEKRTVELSKFQRGMYQDFRNQMEAADQRGEFIMTPTVLAQLTRLRQLCAATPYKEDEYYDPELGRLVYKIRLEEPSSKLDALMDILEDTQRPVVVFSCFNDTLTLLKARLDKKHITYIHMEQKDGDITRQKKVQVFQEGKAQVFLTGIKLGGESITLTAADIVVFIDREWNPQRNEQAIARCWRPGQKNAVQVFHINAARTVDQKVEADIFGKMVTWKQVFE